MRWKLWLEILGMATSLAALFGVFGILLNIFFHGQFTPPLTSIIIKEPHLFILILELALVIISIPIMIFIGIKDIQGLVDIKKKIGKEASTDRKLEEKTSSIFLRAMVFGLTLALVIGMVIYVDEINYKNQQLRYDVKTLENKVAGLDTTVHILNDDIIDKESIIENLTSELEDVKNQTIED